MAGFDHIAFASSDLAEGVDFVEQLTGVKPAPGGPHTGIGTHNALLSLGEDVYLEIIGKDPNQPEPARPRPFGLDDGLSPRVTSFAIHATEGETIDGVAETLRAAGEDPGPVVGMSRVQPSGEEISWRLTLSAQPGLVPFIIDWGDTPNPATVTPQGCTLVELRGTHPDPGTLRSLHDSLGLPTVITEGPVALVAVLDTPNGRVELR
ncbi:MAG: VOC family protein [Acidimicrobiales bacterium]|jgi:hypothetical protein